MSQNDPSRRRRGDGMVRDTPTGASRWYGDSEGRGPRTRANDMYVQSGAAVVSLPDRSRSRPVAARRVSARGVSWGRPSCVEIGPAAVPRPSQLGTADVGSFRTGVVACNDEKGWCDEP